MNAAERPGLIHFGDPAPAASLDRPAADRVIGEPPLRETRERYGADDGAISMGDWACGVGSWRVNFHAGRHEFFQVIDGCIRIHDDATGVTREYRAGDACIIPAGFKGIFEVVEPVSKRYVMFDRRPANPRSGGVVMDDTQRGTQVHAPDLDWSQVRETVLMLQLAAGQVQAAMRESNASVDVLTETFTSMASTMGRIHTALRAIPEAAMVADSREQLQIGAHEVSKSVHDAILAFQFYDRLVQRLDHVCGGLAHLSDLVADKSRLYNPDEWVALQRELQSKYTMAEEREMFQAVMAGVPVQQALHDYMAARMQKVEDSGGDIELF